MFSLSHRSDDTKTDCEKSEEDPDWKYALGDAANYNHTDVRNRSEIILFRIVCEKEFTRGCICPILVPCDYFTG